MSTKRASVKCEICDFCMLLKIGMGSEKKQPHIFDCPACFTPITVMLEKSETNYKFHYEQNCIQTTQEEEQALNAKEWEIDENNKSLINLNSSFAYDKGSIHFPLANLLLNSQSISEITEIAQQRWMSFHSRLVDIAHYFDVPDCLEIWKEIIQPIYILESQNKTEKTKKLVEKYVNERKKYVPVVNVKSHKDIHNDFFCSMFYPRFNDIHSIINKIIVRAKNKDETELLKFLNFYKDNHWKDFQRQSFQVFDDYFSLTTEFAQMRFYARAGKSEVDSLVVGSKNFDRTKLFYGHAYEVISDGYIFLAGLFNIVNGRNFNEFQSMTLEKYINDVNKDSRANPLKSHTDFNLFLYEMDSTLRNGSHHASIYRDQDIVYYRSGGTGMSRDISYARYLFLCNRLMILNSALFCVIYKWLGNYKL